jgi:tetratricopeptide (TPR) repeat protein
MVGRREEGLKLLEQTIAQQRATVGFDHTDTLQSMSDLGRTYVSLGRHNEALKLYEESLALQKARYPNRDKTQLMDRMAYTLTTLGRHEDALKLREEAFAFIKAARGLDHPRTRYFMEALAKSYTAVNRHAEAVELAARVVELVPTFPDYWGTLGAARFRAGDGTAALADLQKAISLRREDHPRNAYEGFVLAMIHSQLGNPDEARDWFDKSVRWMAKSEDVELIRLRTEVEERLGVKAEKKD